MNSKNIPSLKATSLTKPVFKIFNASHNQKISSLEFLRCHAHPQNIIEFINLTPNCDHTLICKDCMLTIKKASGYLGTNGLASSYIKSAKEFLEKPIKKDMNSDFEKIDYVTPEIHGKVLDNETNVINRVSAHIEEEKQKISISIQKMREEFDRFWTEKEEEMHGMLNENLRQLKVNFEVFKEQIKFLNSQKNRNEDIKHQGVLDVMKLSQKVENKSSYKISNFDELKLNQIRAYTDVVTRTLLYERDFLPKLELSDYTNSTILMNKLKSIVNVECKIVSDSIVIDKTPTKSANWKHGISLNKLENRRKGPYFTQILIIYQYRRSQKVCINYPLTV